MQGLSRMLGAVGRQVKAFFTSTTHPVNLAVFRVAVAIALVHALGREDLTVITGLPEAWRVPLRGYGALFHLIPWDTTVALSALYLAYLCAVLMGIGFMTRTSAFLSMVLSLYVLGLPECFGPVSHKTHVLIWSCALLSVSRAGDVGSIDALIRKRRGEFCAVAPGRSYALPLRFVWLWIGGIYFFPGLHKLLAGPAWVLSDNLQWQMYGQWLIRDFIPFIRIDRLPLLCKALAIGTIVLELLFIFLLFSDRLRPYAAAAGFTFHLMIAYVMRIQFIELMICYVAFVDWHRMYMYIRGDSNQPAREQPAGCRGASCRGVIVVGSLLLIANVTCGIIRVDSWPITQFPKFSNIVREPARRIIQLVARDQNEVVHAIQLPIRARILKRVSTDDEAERARLLQHFPEFLEHLGLMPERPYTFEVYEVKRSTIPEEREHEPLLRSLLYRSTRDQRQPSMTTEST